MFEKTLTDMVKGIRAHKKDEARYIAACLRECKEELAQNDIALACGCVAPGGCAQCSAPCAAMFETVYTRCGDVVAASGDAGSWSAFQAQCQEQAAGAEFAKEG